MCRAGVLLHAPAAPLSVQCYSKQTGCDSKQCNHLQLKQLAKGLMAAMYCIKAGLPTSWQVTACRPEFWPDQHPWLQHHPVATCAVHTCSAFNPCTPDDCQHEPSVHKTQPLVTACLEVRHMVRSRQQSPPPSVALHRLAHGQPHIQRILSSEVSTVNAVDAKQLPPPLPCD